MVSVVQSIWVIWTRSCHGSNVPPTWNPSQNITYRKTLLELKKRKAVSTKHLNTSYSGWYKISPNYKLWMLIPLLIWRTHFILKAFHAVPLPLSRSPLLLATVKIQVIDDVSRVNDKKLFLSIILYMFGTFDCVFLLFKVSVFSASLIAN